MQQAIGCAKYHALKNKNKKNKQEKVGWGNDPLGCSPPAPMTTVDQIDNDRQRKKDLNQI